MNETQISQIRFWDPHGTISSVMLFVKHQQKGFLIIASSCVRKGFFTSTRVSSMEGFAACLDFPGNTHCLLTPLPRVLRSQAALGTPTSSWVTRDHPEARVLAPAAPPSPRMRPNWFISISNDSTALALVPGSPSGSWTRVPHLPSGTF